MSNNTTHEIVVPVLPESVADAVVISWYKKVGDFIERDEALVDIETDKVVLEVPSPVAGILTEIIEHDGSTVIGRQKLGSIVAAKADTKQNSSAPKDLDSSNDNSSNETHNEVIVSPAAKKMLIENNLTQSQVKGSGKGGRILKEDVLRLLADTEATPPIPEFVKDKLIKENTNSDVSTLFRTVF